MEACCLENVMVYKEQLVPPEIHYPVLLGIHVYGDGFSHCIFFYFDIAFTLHVYSDVAYHEKSKLNKNLFTDVISTVVLLRKYFVFFKPALTRSKRKNCSTLF